MRVQKLAGQLGWYPGARYTNLRDIRDSQFKNRGFLDIDWRKYNFDAHLQATRTTNPLLTVARDIVSISELDSVLREAEKLAKYAKHVIIVPKDRRLQGKLNRLIPAHLLLGFSVPTRYGETPIPPAEFDRPVHLLGGRPEIQRALANEMPVVSVDCNRFTLDAAFGDYFDGEKFRPHPKGGYLRCLRESILNINRLWLCYRVKHVRGIERPKMQRKLPDKSS